MSQEMTPTINTPVEDREAWQGTSELFVLTDDQLAYSVPDSLDASSFVEQNARDQEILASAASEVWQFRDKLDQEPDVWGLFGFVHEDGKIQIPTNEQLNQIRQGLVEKTGIHTGTFVDFEGDFIEDETFIDFLRQRQIPIVTGPDPYFAAHDMLSHRPAYAAMSAPMFDRFVDLATKAHDRQDPKMVEDVISAWDNLTGYMGFTLGLKSRDGRGYLARYYRELMPPIVSGMRAASDARAQMRTAAALRTVAAEKTREQPLPALV